MTRPGLAREAWEGRSGETWPGGVCTGTVSDSLCRAGPGGGEWHGDDARSLVARRAAHGARLVGFAGAAHSSVRIISVRDGSMSETARL